MKQRENFFTKKDNSIAIYTALCILRKMKDSLGLDAMLEYHESYLNTIEEHNPKVKNAVQIALSMMDVRKMYMDARSCEGTQ